MDYKFISFLTLFYLTHCFDCSAQSNFRGWFDAGQTWLVWEDTEPYPETYLIYKSSEQVTSISGAELAGRIFRIEGTGKKLKKVSSDYTWKIPDGNGGIYTLKENEALFVYTPQEEESAYFAVLRDDNDVISPGNRMGPIRQVIDTIRCHLQAEGLQEDFPFRIFAHWIYGNENYDSGRADYPVMGNEYLNGTGKLFRIWEYPEGERPELLPMNIYMHGGGGYYGNFCPCYDEIYKTYMVSAMVFCPDDGIFCKKSGQIKSLRTYWTGHWERFNRFLSPEDQPIPDSALIVNYTMRRLIWEIDWLIKSEDVDPKRISLMGGSMGGRGANYLVRAYPEKFSSWLSLSPGIFPPEDDPLVGSADQNLKTNFPGSPGILEVMNLYSVLSESERDIPFGKIVGGRNDQSLAALTPDVIQAYKNVNNAGHGAHIYWDDRGHVYTGGSYWSDSERLTAESLTWYRADQSFPAFFNDDQDLTTPGRQPDLGTDNSDGDPWGTWGGYYDWDPLSIEDTPSIWRVHVFLVSYSSYDNDIPLFDSSKTDFTIRRPRQFKPTEGSLIEWNMKRISDGRILQSGQVSAGKNGFVMISGLTIHKERCELTVTAESTSVFPRKAVMPYISPNPFDEITLLEYSIRRQGDVRITVYNTSGQLIEVLVDTYKAAGRYTIQWDAGKLPVGIYYCMIKTPHVIYVVKCIKASGNVTKSIF